MWCYQDLESKNQQIREKFFAVLLVKGRRSDSLLDVKRSYPMQKGMVEERRDVEEIRKG